MDENTMNLLINLGIQIPVVVAFIWFTMQLINVGVKSVEGIQQKYAETIQNILESCEKSNERVLEYMRHRDKDLSGEMGELKTAVLRLETAVEGMGD